MNRFQWTALATGVMFGSLSWAVWQGSSAVLDVDSTIHIWVVTTRTQPSIVVARAISEIGSTYVAVPLIAAMGVLALWHRPFAVRNAGASLLTATAALGMVSGLAVNAGVNGVRPDAVDWLSPAGGPSYPSGHTTVATILAASVAWAWTVHRGQTWPRADAWITCFSIAGSVGLSRVWLGVHWPSDVVGGWLFGAMWVAAALDVTTRLRLRRNRRLALSSSAH